MSIKTDKIAMVGVYPIQLTGYFNPYLSVSYQIELTMSEYPYPNKDAPRLSQPITSPISVTLNAEKVVKHAVIKDPDEDPFTVTVTLKDGSLLPDFITYDPV